MSDNKNNKLITVQNDKPELLSRHAVATMLGVTRQTVANYVSRGIFKEVHSDKRCFVTRKSVNRVLLDLRTDDEIQKKIFIFRKELQNELQRSINRLKQAKENDSIINLLSTKGGRQAVVTVIQGMGENHIPKSVACSICEFLKGRNVADILKEFRLKSTEALRRRLSKALKTIEKLPSYSDLENEINELKRERDALNLYIKELERNDSVLRGSEKSPDMGELELMTRSIKDLDIGRREVNALGFRHVETIGDLVKLSISDLFQIRNIGKKSVSRIEDALEEIGLSLRSEKIIDKGKL